MSWSGITFWYAVITFIAFLVFCVVTTIGGVFDLIYLFKSLKDQNK